MFPYKSVKMASANVILNNSSAPTLKPSSLPSRTPTISPTVSPSVHPSLAPFVATIEASFTVIQVLDGVVNCTRLPTIAGKVVCDAALGFIHVKTNASCKYTSGICNSTSNFRSTPSSSSATFSYNITYPARDSNSASSSGLTLQSDLFAAVQSGGFSAALGRCAASTGIGGLRTATSSQPPVLGAIHWHAITPSSSSAAPAAVPGTRTAAAVAGVDVTLLISALVPAVCLLGLLIVAFACRMRSGPKNKRGSYMLEYGTMYGAQRNFHKKNPLGGPPNPLQSRGPERGGAVYSAPGSPETRTVADAVRRIEKDRGKDDPKSSNTVGAATKVSGKQSTQQQQWSDVAAGAARAAAAVAANRLQRTSRVGRTHGGTGTGPKDVSRTSSALGNGDLGSAEDGGEAFRGVPRAILKVTRNPEQYTSYVTDTPRGATTPPAPPVPPEPAEPAPWWRVLLAPPSARPAPRPARLPSPTPSPPASAPPSPTRAGETRAATDTSAATTSSPVVLAALPSAAASSSSSPAAGVELVPLEGLSAAEVGRLVQSLGLGRFEGLFLAAGITGVSLATARAPEDLAALGLADLPESFARQLLRRLKGYRELGVSTHLLRP